MQAPLLSVVERCVKGKYLWKKYLNFGMHIIICCVYLKHNKVVSPLI